MEPELVARLEIRDRGDGQRNTAASHVDVDLGAGEIEARLAACDRRDRNQQQQEERQTPQKSHSPSLDGADRGRDGRQMQVTHRRTVTD